jgi:non-specific serine/threonine protein kinase
VTATFAEQLRVLRRGARLLQTELAGRAGLSVRAISDLERGLRRAPRRETVDRLADALELTPEQRRVLGGSVARVRQRRVGQSPLPSNLPAPLTSFVGREREMGELRHLVQATRLVTLTGPPGIGKTRLGIHVASQMAHVFPDGIQLVELAALSDPALVERAVAAAMGVHEPTGRPLAEHIGQRTMLLVLDNCEHLAARCAELADTLLQACAQLHVLATSRQSLGVTGEALYRLAAMRMPAQTRSLDVDRIAACDATRLFVDRARAVRPEFTVGRDNAAAIAGVCRRLEGIPLALELAAIWVRALAVEQIVTRLDDRYRLLTGGSRTATPRHQTLRSAVEWSYELLSEPDRALFRRLSVFAGGWTLEAAEAVCSGDDIPPAETLDVLARLVDASLVAVDEHAGMARYRLLETLREYAAERLAESDEAMNVRERHRAWCVTLAEAGERDIWRADQVTCVQRLEREHDNLRAALAWTLTQAGDPEPGLRMAAALARFWDTQGDIREAIAWLSSLLAHPAVRRHSVAWARALTALGYLTAVRGDSPRAVALLDESLAFWRAVGEPRALAVAVFFRGVAVGWPEGDAAALPYFVESLELARARGPLWTAYLSLACLGEGARVLGDAGRAGRLLEEALGLIQAAGDRWGGFFVHNSLGLLALAQGDIGRARASAFEALRQALEFGNMRGATMGLESLGCAAVADKQPGRGVCLFGAAHALRAPIGDFAHATVRGDRERAIASARAQLTDAQFEAAWAAGLKMSMDEAVDFARSTHRPPGQARVLTPRETEVLRLVSDGQTNREIARRLVISDGTVKRHLDHIFAKLNVSSRAAATALAVRAGLT